MCLSKAYIDKGDGRELVMEEIASVDIDDGRLRLRSLFGEEREVVAKVKEINFVTNSMLLEDKQVV
jgi:predicted RNA-binding protein